MAASPNALPWFETARIAAKCTQAAPAMARLLTMRPSLVELAKVERVTFSKAGTNGDWFNGGASQRGYFGPSPGMTPGGSV